MIFKPMPGSETPAAAVHVRKFAPGGCDNTGKISATCLLRSFVFIGSFYSPIGAVFFYYILLPTWVILWGQNVGKYSSTISTMEHM